MTQVYTSSMIHAPAADVWRVIRNFNGLADWTNFVAESRIEQNMAPDQIGCVRNFTLKNGSRIRERLLGLSDYDLSCTYAMLEGDMGVDNYIATLSLTPVTDGNVTFAEWTAEFDCAEGREAELVRQIGQGVFQSAFDSLKQRFR